MRTTLNLAYLQRRNPRGVFIATREEGGQETGPGPKCGRGRGCTAAETRPRPRFRSPLGARAPALWATCFPRGPLSPGAYKYPPGVFSLSRSRVRANFCNLIFRFVVVVVVLLVVVLAIRVKERVCVSVVFEGWQANTSTTSLPSFHLLVFAIYFYFLIVV